MPFSSADIRSIPAPFHKPVCAMPRAAAKRYASLTPYVLFGGADPRYDVLVKTETAAASHVGSRKLHSPFWTRVLTGGLWRWRGEPAWSAALAVWGPMAVHWSPMVAAVGLFWSVAANTFWMGLDEAVVHGAGVAAVAAYGVTDVATLAVSPVVCEFAGSMARRLVLTATKTKSGKPLLRQWASDAVGFGAIAWVAHDTAFAATQLCIDII